MKKYLTTLLLLFACYQAYSQDFAIRLKLKPQENPNYVADEDAVLKTLSLKHNLKFYQSCPSPRSTTELLLFYNLEGKMNKDIVIKDYFATGKFDENYIYEYDTVYLASCLNPVSVNDPHFLNANSWALDMIEAPCAWKITQGSPSILIGVADTDFELAHQDLQNKYEYVIGSTSAGNHHGTAVASVAAAETNNGIGVASVGYNSKIAAHRIVHTIDPNTGQTTASSKDIFNAIWNLYQRGVPIINVSWSGTGMDWMIAAQMPPSGTTLVLAGGNETTSTSHSDIATIPGVIVVSAVNSSNMHGPTNFARNQWIDICAPGISIMVARNGNTYSTGSGTSFSAPFVAGVCALIKSVNNSLTPAQIESVIKATADPIADGNQFPGQLGAGRINAYKAVRYAIENYCNSTTLQGTQTTKKVYCKNIILQNSTIPNGVKLELIATEKITIGANVTVDTGATLELKALGTTVIDYGTFKVMENASFKIW